MHAELFVRIFLSNGTDGADNSWTFQKIPEKSRKFKNVLENSRTIKNILDTSGKFIQILEDSCKFKKIREDSKKVNVYNISKTILKLSRGQFTFGSSCEFWILGEFKKIQK